MSQTFTECLKTELLCKEKLRIKKLDIRSLPISKKQTLGLYLLKVLAVSLTYFFFLKIKNTKDYLKNREFQLRKIFSAFIQIVVFPYNQYTYCQVFGSALQQEVFEMCFFFFFSFFFFI